MIPRLVQNLHVRLILEVACVNNSSFKKERGLVEAAMIGQSYKSLNYFQTFIIGRRWKGAEKMHQRQEFREAPKQLVHLRNEPPCTKTEKVPYALCDEPTTV